MWDFIFPCFPSRGNVTKKFSNQKTLQRKVSIRANYMHYHSEMIGRLFLTATFQKETVTESSAFISSHVVLLFF